MSTAGRMFANLLAGMALLFSVEIGLSLIFQGSFLALIPLAYPIILVIGFTAPGYPWGKFLDKVVGGYDD